MPRAAEPNSCVPAQDCTQQEVNYGAQVPQWQELPPRGPGAAPKPSGEPAGSVTIFTFTPLQTSLERVGVLLGVTELGVAEPGLKPISSLSSSRLSTYYCVPGLDWALSTEW